MRDFPRRISAVTMSSSSLRPGGQSATRGHANAAPDPEPSPPPRKSPADPVRRQAPMDMLLRFLIRQRHPEIRQKEPRQRREDGMVKGLYLVKAREIDQATSRRHQKSLAPCSILAAPGRRIAGAHHRGAGGDWNRSWTGLGKSLPMSEQQGSACNFCFSRRHFCSFAEGCQSAPSGRRPAYGGRKSVDNRQHNNGPGLP